MFIKVKSSEGYNAEGYIDADAVEAVIRGNGPTLVITSSGATPVLGSPEEILSQVEQARQQTRRPASPHIVTLPCQDGEVVCVDAAEFRSAQSAEYGSIVRYGGDRGGGGERFAFCLLPPAEVVRLVRGGT